MAWTPAINDGFYNGANPKRLTCDVTGFYRISYSVRYAQYEHFNFVRGTRPTALAITTRCTRRLRT